MKDRIFELRRSGFSYNQIAEKLGCAKSTISYYCKTYGLSDIGLNGLRKLDRGIGICDNCEQEFKIPKTDQKFCSRECYHLSNRKKELGRLFGIKSSQLQKENKRSKNEIYFYELCRDHFSKVSCNDNIFNGWDADVIIEDTKTAVLWNGKWHYEKITKEHSVEQVQNRDRIKIEEIKKCGYLPYIIKDMGRENKKFVELEFEKMIKNMPL